MKYSAEENNKVIAIALSLNEQKHVSRDEWVIGRLESVIQFQWKANLYIYILHCIIAIYAYTFVYIELYLYYAPYEQNCLFTHAHGPHSLTITFVHGVYVFFLSFPSLSFS